MSPNMRSNSSISTRSVRKSGSVTQVMSTLPDASISTTSPEPEVVELPRSRSRANEFFESPAFRLQWDNDVKHHLARHLLHLRRYREWSQADVAKRMGTSQSAIARIEAGQENITLATLERLINALQGRFQVSIQPAELNSGRFTPWWEIGDAIASTAIPWTTRFVAYQRTGLGERALVGLERGTFESGLLLKSAGTYHSTAYGKEE
jgi:transcriptional regulator with XRE-family HTH domain